MTPRARTACRNGLFALTVVGTVSTVALAPKLSDVAFAVVFAVYSAVGWLVARRQPGNRVGWLLLVFGAIGGFNGILWAWSAAAAAAGLPGEAMAKWSQSWLWAAMLGIIFGPVLVHFPDGRLLSPRWRVVLWLSVVFAVLAGFGNAFYPFPADAGGPNPYAWPDAEPLLRWSQNIGGVALMLSLLGGVAGLIVRYRRSDVIQRLQLKWFLAAAVLLPVATVVGEMRNQALQPVAIPVALALMAAAIGIGILRHGLFDIDKLISRTLAYALLTVVLGGVYLLLVTAFTSVLTLLLADTAIAVAAATLVVAGAFQPVRRHVQAMVDRRFNRAHYDAVRITEAYRTRLRDQLDLDTIADDLVAAVQPTLQPRDAIVWISDAGVQRP